MNDSSSRHLIIVISVASVMLIVLSALPLGDLTGNVLKDFDLFEDLVSERKQQQNEVQLTVDPDLDDALAELARETSSETSPQQPQIPQALSDSVEPVKEDSVVTDVVAPVYEGDVPVESYTGNGVLTHFRTALAQASSRLVRIAVIGDSFIEGDILTQDLRAALQQRYGGCGVGFMAMHSDFPGFRKSVRQTDKGWTMHDLRTLYKSDTIRTISGDYARGESGARTTFKGVSLYPQTASWERSCFICIAPSGGTVTFTTDAGTVPFTLEASRTPQYIKIDGTTKSFSIHSDINDIVALGAYLDGTSGVQVDCMSIRGYAGLGHRKTDVWLADKLSEWVDYDLIILEYGTNAISAGQLDYTSYGKAVELSVKRIRQCYPHADILIMGVGDRGTKTGSVITSMQACEPMVKAQRNVAARCRVHFWDMRAAMGGEGAAAAWRKRKLMNADYVHLNHDGGREMAGLLFKALCGEDSDE